MSKKKNEKRNKLPFDFTQEEIIILKQCRDEALFYRSIPLAFVFSGLAYIGVKRGAFAGHRKYGFVPKVISASVLGYILGKYSYRKECEKKFLKLENSQVADSIRRYRKLPPSHQGYDQNFNEEFSSNAAENNSTSQSSLIEEYYPDLSQHNDGSDSYDSVTESLNPYTTVEEEDDSRQLNVSYEDLRKKNRAQYENHGSPSSRHSPIALSSSNNQSGFNPSYSAPDEGKMRSSPKEPYFNEKINKYGDVWEE